MKVLGLITLSIVLFSAQCAFALSLTLENKTGKELHELYFAPSSSEEWGPDQLGDEVVQNGETYKLSKIPAGKYDVSFVDEHGEYCNIHNVNFTESEHFVMEKALINNCKKATAKEEAAAEEEE